MSATARPFVLPAIGLMAGMAAAYFMGKVSFFFLAAALLEGVAVGCAFVFYVQRRWGVCAAAFFLGAMLMANALSVPLGHITGYFSFLRGKEVQSRGIVVSEVGVGRINGMNRSSFTVDLRAINAGRGWEKISGKVLVHSFARSDVAYGDEVILKGKVSRPFEAQNSKTSYRDYLCRKGVFFAMTLKKISPPQVISRGAGDPLIAFSIRIAVRAKKIYGVYFSLHEAALMNALVLGDQKNVPRHIRTLFAQTGAAHLLAVSGFNVGVMAFGVFLLLKMLPFPRRMRFLMTIAAVVFYSLLTGATAAVVRATVMSVVFLSSFLFEREADVFNSLAFSAICILVLDPMQLFDIGFQLSYACVASILCWSPFWSEKEVSGGKAGRFILEALGVTLAATLGSVALTSYYFGFVAPVSLVSNIPLVPLVALITVLGAGVLLFFWFPFLAGLFAVCTKVALNMAVGLVYLFSLVPGGAYKIDDMSFWWGICFYGALTGVWFLVRVIKSGRGEVRSFWGLGI